MQFGPNQTQRPALQMLLNFFFQQSPIVSLLAEARRNHHRRFHARVDTLSNDLRHGLRRRHHQRQVDSSGNVSDMFVGLDPEDFAVAGIHGIHFDRKFALQQIRNHAATDGARADRWLRSPRPSEAERATPIPLARGRGSIDFADGRGHCGAGYFTQRVPSAKRGCRSFFHNCQRAQKRRPRTPLPSCHSFLRSSVIAMYLKSRGLVMVITRTNAVLQFLQKEVLSARPLWPQYS